MYNMVNFIFRDQKHALACRDYLKRSMELGKLLRKTIGPAAEKVFNEEGDCLSQLVPYSERLAEVEGYLGKKKSLRSRRARKRLSE